MRVKAAEGHPRSLCDASHPCQCGGGYSGGRTGSSAVHAVLRSFVARLADGTHCTRRPRSRPGPGGISFLRTHRLWYSAACAVAAGAVAIIAGCGGSGSGTSPAGSSAASTTARAPSASGVPSASRPPSFQGPVRTPSSAASAARKVAQAVQGDAAVPTAAQLSALRVQAREIARLSPRQLAGQRVIYSYNGLTAPPGLLSLIRHGDVGGVIFFSFNISSEAQISAVINQMIAANGSSQNPARNYPLLLMTDQEGGEVRRLTWRSAGVRGADRRIGLARHAGSCRRRRRGRQPARCRHEPEPGAGPRRVPAARRLRRPVPALLQHEPADRRGSGSGLRHGAAGGAGRRHR